MDGQEGFDFVFKLCRICLRSIGAWPELYQSPVGKVLTEFHYFANLFILIFFVNFMQTVQLINCWGDIDVMTNVLSTADLPIANVTCMMIKFWFKRQVLCDLIAVVRNDWSRAKSKKELQLMKASATKARNLAAICVSLGQGACIFYLVLHVYLQFTLDLDFRLLYLNAYIPYDSQTSPNYELTWLFQCMSTFISTAGFVGFESFFVIVVMHVCGQLHCLRHRFSNLNCDSGQMHLRREIAAIIEQHNRLYRIAYDIEDIFNSVNLVQLMNFTVIFCMLGFRAVIVNTSAASYVLYLVSSLTLQILIKMFACRQMIKQGDGTLIEAIFVVGFFTYLSSNLFICCYVAEQLRSESLAVEFAAYDSCWYNMDTKDAQLLINVLMRSKRPFEITAGKFFIFSLDTFSSLMKTSASYMSVLIAMKTEDDN